MLYFYWVVIIISDERLPVAAGEIRLHLGQCLGLGHSSRSAVAAVGRAAPELSLCFGMLVSFCDFIDYEALEFRWVFAVVRKLLGFQRLRDMVVDSGLPVYFFDSHIISFVIAVRKSH